MDDDVDESDSSLDDDSDGSVADERSIVQLSHFHSWTSGLLCGTCCLVGFAKGCH